MRKVYVDECGYTGEHLLDRDQPFQAASAIEISEEESKDLIEKHFPRYQAPELKHQKMSKRPGNWEGLLNIQRELLLNFPCHSYVADKRFMLIQKFLGNCVEPFYHAQGINFFENGALEQAASMLYYCAPPLLGEDRFNQFLNQYQKAARTKETAEVQKLITIADSLSQIEFSEIFGPLGSGLSLAIEELLEPEVNLDLAYLLVIGLITLCETRSGFYEIIHDQSENMKQYAEGFQSLIGVTEEKSFKMSDVCRISFPLKLKGVEQIDSKKSSAVQLADILTGGAVEMVKSLTINEGKASEYAQNLNGIYAEAPTESFIFQFPSKDLKEIQERRKGNQSEDFINFGAGRLK